MNWSPLMLCAQEITKMLLKAEKIDNKTDEKKSKKHGAWKNNKWVAQQKISKNLYTNIMIDNWAKYMEDLFIEVIDDIKDICACKDTMLTSTICAWKDTRLDVKKNIVNH